MIANVKRVSPILLLCLTCVCMADIPEYRAELIRAFDVPSARQGVAVDRDYFYVVDKRTISKHDKMTGETVAEWPSESEENLLKHMDSLMEWNGKLYAAHSNYPDFPMTSSVEIWDAVTLQHVATHSFGIERGSFTWLDRHDGFWWGTFANYDKVQSDQTQPYGMTNATQVVKMDDNFRVVESWTLPMNILNRVRPMSNSGGSWGPDGYLYLTGHDHGEIHVVDLPDAGSILHQVAIVKVPVMEGQGIAWDRSTNELQLWGINKQKTQVARLRMPSLRELSSRQ